MENILVKKVTTPDAKILSGINVLLKQWSDNDYQITPEYFTVLIKNSHVLVMQEGEKVIGSVTIIPLYKLSGLKGSVEHVVVDLAYQGKGLGEFIMRQAIEYAKKSGIHSLFLTCEPHRVSANALYKKVGFTVRDTQFYQLSL